MMPISSANLHLEKTPDIVQMPPARVRPCGAPESPEGCSCAKLNTSPGLMGPVVEKGNGVLMGSAFSRWTRSIMRYVSGFAV